jgi:nucleotide-binding universal stress UspA family protein
MKTQPPVGRILVGIDGSPAAGLRGMRLHVVHARDQDAAEAAHYALPGAGHVLGHAADGHTLKALVRETVGPDGWSAVPLEVVDGLPVRVLLERAPGAAMLVLGSTRSVGLADAPVGKPRAPLGPVARDCLRAAPCPVVIVAEPSVQPAEAVRIG